MKEEEQGSHLLSAACEGVGGIKQEFRVSDSGLTHLKSSNLKHASVLRFLPAADNQVTFLHTPHVIFQFLIADAQGNSISYLS